MKHPMTVIFTLASLNLTVGFLSAKPPPQLPPLIAAAAAGDPGTVRRLLSHGADVRARSSVPHDHTALEAAIWHRQNDIERIAAGPPDSAGHGMENQPLYSDGAVKDEDYRKVIGMLRQAVRERAKRTRNRHWKCRFLSGLPVPTLRVSLRCRVK